jgi:2-polyprenyl-6-hydroxyphenyl methylase / 3-demethylubiquinone-9 3-methyltransferase
MWARWATCERCSAGPGPELHLRRESANIRGVPVDNEMYDRLADGWWDAESSLYTLRSGLNPARFPYLRRTMVETLGIDPAGAAVLDVGCGGGLLAEEFARLGCRVTGVDPSSASLETAQGHARDGGLDIAYVQGCGEAMQFDDAAFDVVYCCDVLEHVDDVGKTVAEIARVLKPGGAFLYDTINRTLRSNLVMIKLMQEWDWTRCMEPGLHDWNMFIRPKELRDHLENADLEPGPVVGIAPKASPPRLVLLLRARRRGELDFAEFGERLQMRESRDKSILYAGYAVKPAARGERSL